MPPRLYSRHSFTTAETDSDGRLYLAGREPFRFRALADNREHVVTEADTLDNLAGIYFKPLPRPAGLWWVISDFQPDPIHDPTIKLAVGRVLYIPSVRTVIESVFAESRREESNVT